jgi:SAM-dependent methyltransferase
VTTLARLETLAEADHFNQEVFRRVERFIGRRTLEVGTGIGIFTHRLLARCDLVVGVDVVPEFVARCATRFASAANLELHHAAMGCGVPPPLAGRSFDTIVCMNVLEHIEDDQRTLADLFTLLEPGGRLVLVVPQYPWLYNALDANDGHYRRYRRPGLAARLGTAGFALEHTSRFNLAGIAGWFINGTLLRRRELPNEQMRLYDRLVPWLFRLERLVGPPAGLSLLMVARRPPA